MAKKNIPKDDEMLLIKLKNTKKEIQKLEKDLEKIYKKLSKIKEKKNNK